MAQHKHHDCIVAWAKGETIEILTKFGHGWQEVNGTPLWGEHYEYRIKPDPKPDVIRYARASADDVEPIPVPKQWSDAKSSTWWSVRKAGSDNVRAIFDGETGKLKAVELL